MCYNYQLNLQKLTSCFGCIETTSTRSNQLNECIESSSVCTATTCNKITVYRWDEGHPYYFYILRIQVERLMTSVIAFVITVDWLRCEANCQVLLGGDDIVLSGKRCLV